MKTPTLSKEAELLKEFDLHMSIAINPKATDEEWLDNWAKMKAIVSKSFRAGEQSAILAERGQMKTPTQTPILNKCQWCGKEKNEEGKYDDAGNWQCKRCFIEHNAR